MIRRLFSASLTLAFVNLSIICLVLIVFLVYSLLTADPAWRVYALSLGFCLLMGGIWYVLKGEVSGGRRSKNQLH
ncbi:MAG: hypothetical protein JST28_16120 [Acidobacteria bacterium]|nr:hypothetical protein [Acidobacteriota bacterium]